MLGLVAALLFKSGAAPLHAWAPDAYETAPASAAAALAGAFKVGMVGALATVVAALGIAGADASGDALGPLLLPVFGTVGAAALLSIVVGSTVALTTGSYRRMLAYAGVAQVGYALIALGALNPPAGLVLIVTYGIAATAAFVAAEVFAGLRPEWDGSIAGLSGLGRSAPGHRRRRGRDDVLAGGDSAAASASGASSRRLRQRSGPRRSSSPMAGPGSACGWVSLALVGVLGSIVSVAYYGNVVRVLLMGESDVVRRRDWVATNRPATAVLIAARSGRLRPRCSHPSSSGSPSRFAGSC